MSTAIDQLRSRQWCKLANVLDRDSARLARTQLYGIGISCGVIAQSYTTNLPMIPFYTRACVVKDTTLFVAALLPGPLLDVVRASLGQSICVTSTTMLIHEPGTEQGPWRRGEPFDAVSQAPHAAARHLMAVLMFSPFDEDNGGLNVMTAEGREQTITGSLGDAVVLAGALQRRVAANRGDFPRLSVHIGFAAATPDTPPPRDPASMLSPAAYARLPQTVRPLFAHWVTA